MSSFTLAQVCFCCGKLCKLLFFFLFVSPSITANLTCVCKVALPREEPAR